jgi:hypothetical protein
VLHLSRARDGTVDAEGARMSFRSWLFASSIVLLTAAPCTAQRAERGPYLHTQLGGGYWHYWQAHYADREADGFALELHGAFAWAVSEEIAIGTAFSGQFYDGGGHGYTTGPWAATATGGGLWGLLFAWMPAGETPPIALEISAGFAGAGAAALWGGFGPYLSPSLTIFFAHHGRSHFGITLRVQYEPMYSDDATPRGAQKNFVLGSVAIGWTFF